MREPFVLFDAVGTLIFPFPGASETYHSIGVSHGCSLSMGEIRSRFRSGFQNHFARADNTYSVPSSEEIERRKWKGVINDVFGNSFTESLFDDLWNHFANPRHWQCYEDSNQIVADLLSNGFRVGVASNFDERLLPIMDALMPQIDPNCLFCSTNVGYSKPDVRFFQQIERTLEQQFGRLQILMIGDNWTLDVESPRRAGWQSCLKTENLLPTIDEIKNHFLRSR